MTPRTTVHRPGRPGTRNRKSTESLLGYSFKWFPHLGPVRVSRVCVVVLFRPTRESVVSPPSSFYTTFSHFQRRIVSRDGTDETVDNPRVRLVFDVSIIDWYGNK